MGEASTGRGHRDNRYGNSCLIRTRSRDFKIRGGLNSKRLITKNVHKRRVVEVPKKTCRE